MDLFSPTLILRHKRENLKKCSLHGLEGRPDCQFFTYPKDTLPTLENYLLLTPGAPELKPADASRGILLVDGTWRYAEKMIQQLQVPHLFECRSLPAHFETAYPRRQEISTGLASIEALYIAYFILGRSTDGLLDFYFWKENFLQKNRDWLTNSN